MHITSLLQDTIAVGLKPKHPRTVPQYKPENSVPDCKSPSVLPFHTSKMRPVGTPDIPRLPTYTGGATHLQKLRQAEPLIREAPRAHGKPDLHDVHLPRPDAAMDKLKELLLSLR